MFDVRMGGIGLSIHPLPLLGGVAVAVSSGLNWFDGARGKASAFDIAFQYIFGDRKSVV